MCSRAGLYSLCAEARELLPLTRPLDERFREAERFGVVHALFYLKALLNYVGRFRVFNKIVHSGESVKPFSVQLNCAEAGAQRREATRFTPKLDCPTLGLLRYLTSTARSSTHNEQDAAFHFVRLNVKVACKLKARDKEENYT